MFLFHFANLGVECLIHMVNLRFTSKETIQMSPEVAAPFNIPPPAAFEVSCFSLLVSISYYLFDCRDLSGWEMVSPSGVICISPMTNIARLMILPNISRMSLLFL